MGAARLLAHVGGQQGVRQPRVDAASVRSYLTHVAIQQQVSASTKNQAFCAILFLCREVLGIDIDGVRDTTRARRGERLPAVMSVAETASLLAAMRSTPRLMAALIYGGGLRVSECCQLRIKDLDFDQDLLFVRAGKGDKDRTTLLADAVREDLRTQVVACERLIGWIVMPGWRASGCPRRSTESTGTLAANSDGSGSSRVGHCPPTRVLASCGATTSANRSFKKR